MSVQNLKSLVRSDLHNRTPIALGAFFQKPRKRLLQGPFGQVIEQDFGHESLFIIVGDKTIQQPHAKAR